MQKSFNDNVFKFYDKKKKIIVLKTKLKKYY